MDMSMFDIGTVLAVLGLFYKLSADKAAHAEEMGKLKQQVKSLETRAAKIDNRLESIDTKLGNLLTAITKLETIIGQKGQSQEIAKHPSTFKWYYFLVEGDRFI